MNAIVKPEIPAELEHLATWKGLAIPYVQVVLADGSPDFRSVHEAKRVECLERHLCGVCGQPLGYYVVFLGTERQISSRTYSEPGLHEVCADYASAACAMIAGRLEVYSSRKHRSDGQPCADPDCDCAGWVPHAPRRPDDWPRHPWWRMRTRGYTARPTRVGLIAYTDRPLDATLIG